MIAPLDGIRVVEIASFVAAPSAGALLADLGAEVIKVEVPEGEVYRHSRPRMNGFKNDLDLSPAFEMDNRGKRSLTLDLRRPDAREALLRVIDRADVVLTNMLPGRRERYGLDSRTLRATRPGLIHAALTGYGADGPEADAPAFDYTAYWARTGMMDLFRAPGATPAFLRPGVGDHAAGVTLVAGILAALRARDRSGRGQDIDVSLLQIGFYVQGNDLSQSLATGETPPMHDRQQPRNPLWNLYPTRDSRWLMLVMIESDRYWPLLCEALERPDLTHDERFAGAVPRYRNSRALVEILDGIFGARTLAEWEAFFARHRLIWAPVREMGEVAHDPQAEAIGSFPTIEHPRVGPMRGVGAPLRMSDWEMPADEPAPELGADAEEVLREAGLSEAAVRRALGRD